MNQLFNLYIVGGIVNEHKTNFTSNEICKNY